jgi:hypothetical protein
VKYKKQLNRKSWCEMNLTQKLLLGLVFLQASQAQGMRSRTWKFVSLAATAAKGVGHKAFTIVKKPLFQVGVVSSSIFGASVAFMAKEYRAKKELLESKQCMLKQQQIEMLKQKQQVREYFLNYFVKDLGVHGSPDNYSDRLWSLNKQIAEVQRQMDESSSETWKTHAQAFLDELKLLKKRLSDMQERASVTDGGIAWYPFYRDSQKVASWGRDNALYLKVSALPKLSPWERWCVYKRLGYYKDASYDLGRGLRKLYSQAFSVDMLRKDLDVEALQVVRDHFLSKKIKEDAVFEARVNAKDYGVASLCCKTLYYFPWELGKSMYLDITRPSTDPLGNEFLPVVQAAFDEAKMERHALLQKLKENA